MTAYLAVLKAQIFNVAVMAVGVSLASTTWGSQC